MQSTKLVGVVLLSSIILGGSTIKAFADDELAGQKKETPVNVTIEEGTTGPEPTDPEVVDPNDEHQKFLTLNKVPTSYDFKSSLQNQEYTITSTLTDQSINVFNSHSKRDWYVKALVKNNVIHTNNGADLDVTSFKVNDVELVGSGASGIVAQAVADKKPVNNTGTIKTTVDSASIKFTDKDSSLVAGDKLTGAISYQLYNVVIPK